MSAPRADETRKFAATTGALIELQEWLSAHGVTHVAMEATGVVLENRSGICWRDTSSSGYHIRNVPGRKTDVSDAAWIAELLERATGADPGTARSERTRKQLARESLSIPGVSTRFLEDANLKLGSLLSDVLGTSASTPSNRITVSYLFQSYGAGLEWSPIPFPSMLSEIRNRHVEAEPAQFYAKDFIWRTS